MSTKKVAPPPTITTKKTLPAEEVQEAIKECKDTVTAILDHYQDLLEVLDDGVKTELAAAFENLQSTVQDIEDAYEEPDFDSLLEQLKELPDSEIESDELLALIDEEDILEHVKGQSPDFVLVKIFSNDHRDRLREFLEKEIYTSYNEQIENILF